MQSGTSDINSICSFWNFLNLSVDLQPNPDLRSQAHSSDWKNKHVDTNDWNKLNLE